jgi:hypothetical protein
MRSLTLALLGAALALGSGCKPREYVCSMDRECTTSGGGSGRCITGHCAYADSACPSGLRFDDTAGDQSDDCVDPSLLQTPDAAPPDVVPAVDVIAAPIDAAAPPVDVVAPPVDAGPPDA